MAKFIFCGECGALKHVEVEPYEHESAGNYSWSGAFCCCPDRACVVKLLITDVNGKTSEKRRVILVEKPRSCDCNAEIWAHTIYICSECGIVRDSEYCKIMSPHRLGVLTKIFI